MGASYAKVAVMGVPAGQATVKLPVVKLAGAMASLNVAEILLLVATPVTAGVADNGTVTEMVGAMPAPGVPRMGSRPPLPPPQPARKVISTNVGSHATRA